MQTNRELTDRFLEMVAQLTEAGITNPHRFCLDVGADRRNFNKMLANPSRHLLRPEWIGNEVLVYGVSANWLVTGSGSMFGL